MFVAILSLLRLTLDLSYSPDASVLELSVQVNRFSRQTEAMAKIEKQASGKLVIERILQP